VIPGPSPFRNVASLFPRDELPTGGVSPGTAPVVAVAAAPRHPSNTVLVQMRRDGGPAQVVRARPETVPFDVGTQWFRTALPTLDEGRHVDYRVELIRAGQRLATLPADGSWLTVTGGPASAPSSETLGETPDGYRINFFVESGRVVGPRIDAVVRPDGGDWMCIRRDGIGVLDVRTTYETTDGALILDRAGGVFDLGPDGYAKVAAGQLTGTPAFYATPTFMTAHPDWQWLNRCQGFGVGRVVLEELQVQCDIYVPQVLGRLDDG
jgi:hypothetical protein